MEAVGLSTEGVRIDGEGTSWHGAVALAPQPAQAAHRRRRGVAGARPVAAGVLVGLLAGVSSADHLEQQRAQLRRVPAVLVNDAKARTGSRSGNVPVSAEVRWTGPDGSSATGRARVAPGTEAGARLTVWANEKGLVTVRPLSPSAALVQATATGVLIGTGAGSIVLAGVPVTRRLFDDRRMRQWEEDWRKTDSRWGGKTR
ncbi:Rv1733c family protein [Streptomyces sp. enrichment culture]|uniref:Rv1733c family protein n=1 Tax=Streptomyces sp. enrichment culture TaxID=1795815 RepID=UPI003F573F62